MRRFSLAAAFAAALFVAACSDQNPPTEPALPTPDETFGSTCTVTPFPLQSVSAQIPGVFPNGRLRNEAQIRAGGIKLFWDTCHPEAARKAAVSFIEWMNEHFSNGRLRGATPAEVQTLTVTILNGVGVPITEPTSTGDIGVGIYDGEKTVIKTASEVALTEIEADAFADGEPRLIVVKRLADNFRLSNFGGNQFEPFFDYDATKLAGATSNADKILAEGKTAIIAFCLFPPPFTYPDNVGIGHNPVEGANGFPFEVLPAVNLPVERPDLVDALKCGQLAEAPGPIIGGIFDRRLPGWVNTAWRTADRFLVPLAENLLVPEPLWAAGAVATLGPIGGKTTSLSPFGTVEVGETDVGEFGIEVGSEGAGPYFVGQPLDTCGDGCYPEFRILDGETAVETPTSITVSLVPGEGSTGTLGGTTTKLTSATDPFTAEFDDLTISAPGSYQLLVTSPGANSYTTGTFSVAADVDAAGVISNGTVTLGVNPAGNLIVLDGGSASSGTGEGGGTTNVGLRLVAGNPEALGGGTPNEGWGIAHPESEVAGYASTLLSPPSNFHVETFSRTETEATSVVRIGSTFRITHHYRPIEVTSSLYEVHVTVENISDQPLSGVVYRRVMNWNIEPTAGDEFISVVGTTNPPGVSASNNGLASANPLVAKGTLGATGDFFNVGPSDHGAVFDVTLSTIFPSGTNTFVIYFGGAENSSAAKAAVRSIGGALLSLARPNIDPLDGSPNSFVVAFSGIGGVPIEIEQMEPPPPPIN